jgi:hypothetical protein
MTATQSSSTSSGSGDVESWNVSHHTKRVRSVLATRRTPLLGMLIPLLLELLDHLDGKIKS